MVVGKELRGEMKRGKERSHNGILQEGDCFRGRGRGKIRVRGDSADGEVGLWGEEEKRD